MRCPAKKGIAAGTNAKGAWHLLMERAKNDACHSGGAVEQTEGRAKPFPQEVDLKLERSIHRLRTTPVQAAPAGTTMVTHYMHPHIGVKQHWATNLPRRGADKFCVLVFRPETTTLQK